MKQPEDNVTRELPVTKAGRKPIGDRPMTAAERKARSRANQLGEVAGQLDVLATAIRIKADLLVDEGRRGMSHAEALEFMRDLLLHVELASIAVPRS